MRKRRAPYLLLLPGALWLTAFFVVPIASMLSLSLQEGTVERGFELTWRWSTYADVLAKFDVQLVRSLTYGLIVTVLCLVVAYPLAYTIALRGGRWKNALLFLVVLPFFVSLIIRTLSWKFILADQGFLLAPMKAIGLVPDGFRFLATPVAVIGGLFYNFLPFMTLPLYVALERMDRSLLEAAGDLYSSRATAFWRVTFPLSLPGVFAGSLLTFIPSVGDFINAELLGGTGTTMIGNVIQYEFLRANDYPEAAALSFILMAGILVGVALYTRVLGTEELSL
ncbi:MAG TPA: ABC transporter permease [Actinomycetota bacterium]|nr:ABC transporter permease [Actinomycetota bacterium]